MTMEKKMTKSENLNAIKTVLIDAAKVMDVDVNFADLIEFVDGEIALLAKRAAKAKETAQRKKEEDPLLDVVKSVMTAEFQSVADIVAAINDEEITPSKVVARTKKLVDANIIEKDVDKKSKKTVYRLVG